LDDIVNHLVGSLYVSIFLWTVLIDRNEPLVISLEANTGTT
jgi:hypothetical protein